jgi:protein farnesyltransferase subunit beta
MGLCFNNRQPDAYHTCYCLSGLAAAQHRILPVKQREKAILILWETSNEDSGV